MDYIDYYKNYRDSSGLVVQKIGTFYNAVDANFLNSNLMYQSFFSGEKELHPIDLFKSSFISNEGLFRRYHKNDTSSQGDKERMLWNFPLTVSRDNTMGAIILMGHLNEREFLKSYIKTILKNYSFFQNQYTTKGENKIFSDFCDLGCWSIISRAYGIAYLPQLFLDVFYGLSVSFSIIKSRILPDHASTVFHELSSAIQAQTKNTTFLSRFFANMYIKYRKGVPDYISDYGVISALKYYSKRDYDPPIHITAYKALINVFKR